MIKMAILKTANGHGKYRDLSTKKDVVDYILNNYKMRNNYWGCIKVNPADPALSMQEVSKFYGKENGVQIRHIIVSFTQAETIDPAVVSAIANEFMCWLGENYQAVYGVHENTENLHFHLAFNSVSYVTGERYKGTRSEHYLMLNVLKSISRKYGIYTVCYGGNI